DQLLVYFAGHGILKSAYWEQWLLSDANNDPNEAVNLESSIKYGRNSRIPHLVFVSDACRSLTTDPNLSQVDGSIIFPTKPPQRTQKRPEVDTFYATAPGDTSLEVPAPQASGAYRALFTEVLLKGLGAPDSSLTEFVTDPQAGRIEVVSSRTLKPY